MNNFVLIFLLIFSFKSEANFKCYELFNSKISNQKQIPSEWLTIDPKEEVSAEFHTVSAEYVTRRTQKSKSDYVVVKRMLDIKKKPLPWRSMSGPFKEAPQGDPRWPIQILGADLAALLGYKMPNKNTVIIPSVAKINDGIDKLNNLLPESEKIPVRFYEQNSDFEFQYLERYATHGEIPISTQNPYLTVHDSSYHVSEIVAPKVFHDVLRQITENIFAPLAKSEDNHSQNNIRKYSTLLIDESVATTTVAHSFKNDKRDIYLMMMAIINSEKPFTSTLMNIQYLPVLFNQMSNLHNFVLENQKLFNELDRKYANAFQVEGKSILASYLFHQELRQIKLNKLAKRILDHAN